MRSYYVPPAPATLPGAPVPTDPARRAEFNAARGQSAPTPKPVAAPPAAPGGAAPAPSSAWVPYSAPGYAEDYYTKHQQDWEKPGSAANYWQGQQGFFTNPTAQENQLNKWGTQLGNTQGAAEDFWGQYGNQMMQPGAAENFWSQYGNQMMQPGRADAGLTDALNTLRGPGAAEQYYTSHGSFFDKPGVAEQLFPQLSAGLGRTGYTEGMAQDYRADPSFNEQFLTGGGATGGLDAVYDRLYSQGSRRLGDEAAARGGYNSGAALRSVEELNRDLTAQHVKDLQSASQAADTSKVARQNLQLNVMQGADQSLLGRLGKLGELGVSTQQAGINRVLGGGTLANQAQEGMLGRANATTGASTALGNLVNQRYATGSAAAERASTAETNRYKAGSDAANQAQTGRTDRMTRAGGLINDAQTQALNRISTGGNLAASAGTEDNTRLVGGMSAANTAQNAKQGRETGVLDNLMKVAQQQAGTYAGMSQQQREAEYRAKEDEINNLLKRGSITADQAKQMRGMYSQLLAMPLSLINRGGAAGGGGGGGAGLDPDYLMGMSK